MLGNNATNNFDLVRNHHYKITMNFKDYGNDIDWHIEYAEKYLDVTYPEDVNYQGKFSSRTIIIKLIWQMPAIPSMIRMLSR